MKMLLCKYLKGNHWYIWTDNKDCQIFTESVAKKHATKLRKCDSKHFVVHIIDAPESK